MPIPLHRLVLIAALALMPAHSSRADPLRVLYFTKSSGFEHSVVHRVDGHPSYSEAVLTRLAAQHDLHLTFSKDGSRFTAGYLAGFDVIMFYTTGDLLSAGLDGQPAMTPAGKQALLDAVAGGKGFVGVHSASDTFHTGVGTFTNATPDARRYGTLGAAADPYIRMLGGEFIIHNAQQTGRVRVIDPGFPGLAGIPSPWELTEEWYSLKEFAPDLHVLLVLDTAGMTGAAYRRPPYPIAWARHEGKGRVWFDAMGHREDVWDHPLFQAMLIGGIEWAGGRRMAPVAPNLASAAPGALHLPAPPSRP
jgi:type 1 glutamine amidotransferase